MSVDWHRINDCIRLVKAALGKKRFKFVGVCNNRSLDVQKVCTKKRRVPMKGRSNDRNQISVEEKEEKELHRPGIEPGSVPWQGTILPLDHRCIGFVASSQESDTGLAIFGIINLR